MTEQNGLKRQEGVSGGDLKKKKKKVGQNCTLSSFFLEQRTARIDTLADSTSMIPLQQVSDTHFPTFTKEQ